MYVHLFRLLDKRKGVTAFRYISLLRVDGHCCAVPRWVQQMGVQPAWRPLGHARTCCCWQFWKPAFGCNLPVQHAGVMVTYDTPGCATRSGGGGSTGHVPPECRSKDRGGREEDAGLLVRTRGRPLFSGSRDGTTAGGERPARHRKLLSVQGYHPLCSRERHAVGVRHVGSRRF
jgi:hypothetical protein